MSSILCFLILWALAFPWASGSYDVSDDACHESPWLCSQMARLQEMVVEQTRFMERQMDDQKRLLEERVEQKIEAERRVMQKQISELQTKVSKQDALINQLHQQITLKDLQKDTDVLQQPHAIPNKPPPPSTNNVLKARPPTSPKKPMMTQSYHLKPRSEDHNPWNRLTNQKLTSESRDMTSRSDDFGALDAVVNQMSQHLTTMDADIQTLKNDQQAFQNSLHQQELAEQTKNDQQDVDIHDARTSTFVRWGNSHCPNDSELIYAGVVGGGPHAAGGNYLCLTMAPVFSSHSFPPTQFLSLVGSEYETQFTDSHDDKDAVCAVCRSLHSTTITIPGTNVCTQGWSQQYSGLLMAAKDGISSTNEFICVDSAFEERQGSGESVESAGLYFTVTKCGTLPCPPYVESKVVTCVVCSK